MYFISGLKRESECERGSEEKDGENHRREKSLQIAYLKRMYPEYTRTLKKEKPNKNTEMYKILKKDM